MACHQFETHIPTLYPLVTDILTKEVAMEMRLAVRDYLHRVGVVKGFLRESEEDASGGTVLWSSGAL